MSRTYNIPSTEQGGTFGQALAAVPYDQLIMTGETQRIIFIDEDDDFRANLGCVNGTNMPIAVDIELYDDEGMLLETVPMGLDPWSNKQINRIFRTSCRSTATWTSPRPLRTRPSTATVRCSTT